MTDIIRIQGSRERKLAAAQRIKAEFVAVFPELAELRQQLIDRGMAANNLSSVPRVVTENIDYQRSRDDPDYYTRQFNKPPIITEEITHAIQARQSNQAVPANTVYDSRGRIRRR